MFNKIYKMKWILSCALELECDIKMPIPILKY